MKTIEDLGNGKKYKNKRLGVIGEINGFVDKPVAIITDESGQRWVVVSGSPFDEEWEEIKE